MSSIKFEYNLKKDAYNYLRIILFRRLFGTSRSLGLIPDNLKEKVQKIYETHPISHSRILEVSDYPAYDLIIEYLKIESVNMPIEDHLKILKKMWPRIEREYFKILSDVLQKPIYTANYKCYLTTLFNCPVYEKESWFMLSLGNDLSNQIYVICHEFMHLQFIYYYKEYCLLKGLDKKQFEHLKESITFLLNEPEFNNIILFKDPGYPDHKILRKRLKEIWRKDKDFQIFLDRAIKITKEEFPVLF